MSNELERYEVLEYGELITWGRGDRVRRILAPLAATKFTHMMPYQDHRQDRGHGEMVTLFGTSLCRLMGISDDDREVVELACIYHDVGWSQIPNVNEVFRRERDDFRSRGFKREKDHPGLWGLRVQHQQYSGNIVRADLSEYRRICDVLDIVEDHDTRLNTPTLLAQIMQDADMLWRVTLLFLRQWCTADEVLAPGFIDAQLTRLTLHLPISREIARIELGRSVEFYKQLSA